MATQSRPRVKLRRRPSARPLPRRLLPRAVVTPPSAASSAKKAAETRAQAQLNTLQVVQLQAERAALVPVGAALTARDAVVEAVKPYVAGRESAEKELEKVGKRVSGQPEEVRAPWLDRSQPRACARSSAPGPAWSASCASAATRPCAR